MTLKPNFTRFEAVQALMISAGHQGDCSAQARKIMNSRGEADLTVALTAAFPYLVDQPVFDDLVFCFGVLLKLERPAQFSYTLLYQLAVKFTESLMHHRGIMLSRLYYTLVRLSVENPATPSALPRRQYRRNEMAVGAA